MGDCCETCGNFMVWFEQDAEWYCTNCLWKDELSKRIAAEAKLARVKDIFGAGDMWNWWDEHRNEARNKLHAILSDTRKPLAVQKVRACKYCGTPRPREKWNDDNDLVCDPCGKKIKRVDAIAVVLPKEVE